MDIFISGILRKYFGGQAVVDGAGGTIRQNLETLVNEYPGAGRILFDDAGKFRRFVSVWSGGENLSSEEVWDRPLTGTDLFLIHAMAGESAGDLPVFVEDLDAEDACKRAGADLCGAGGPAEHPSCCAVSDYCGASDCCGAPADDSPCCGADPCGGQILVPERQNRESIIPEYRRCAVELDDAETARYRNHLALREIGIRGQKRLKAAKVVVAGAGALASPVILYLAAAGVGKIKIVDPGEVAMPNLQSQILHTARDLNRPKSASAKDSARNINKTIQVESENAEIDADNILSLIEGYDLVIDCTDSYKSRYLINDACVLLGIPWIFGAVTRFEGQIGIFDSKSGACYRCLFPTPPPAELLPPDGEEAVFSPLAGVVGSIEASEALKMIAGLGIPAAGKLLLIDALSLRTEQLDVSKNLACPVCGSDPAIRTMDDFDSEQFERPLSTEPLLPIGSIAPDELAHLIDGGVPVMIVDVREPHERTALRFPNAVPIPIGQIERRLREFDPELETIFVCKSGRRSLLAAETLRGLGYKGPVSSLTGGIDAMRDIMFSHEGAWL